MGLMERVQASQGRKALRWAIEQENGRKVAAQAIKQSKDGGLLVHRQLEQAK